MKNPSASAILVLSGLVSALSIPAKPMAAGLATAKSAPQASDSLANPRLTVLTDRKMLVITMAGDPDKVAGQAFKELYKYFYKHAAKQSEKEIPVPRARWPMALSSQDKGTWIGQYGLPVPEGFPSPIQGNLRVEDWKYGLVAEILHVGAYDVEMPTLDRLKDYIRFNGYAILGEYEEEYLIGPGLILKGNPEKYRTILRLRLTKDSQAEQIAARPVFR